MLDKWLVCILYYSGFIRHKRVHFKAVEDAGFSKTFWLSLSIQHIFLNMKDWKNCRININNQWNHIFGVTPLTPDILQWTLFPHACGKNEFHRCHLENCFLKKSLPTKWSLKACLGWLVFKQRCPVIKVPSFRKVTHGTIKQAGPSFCFSNFSR